MHKRKWVLIFSHVFYFVTFCAFFTTTSGLNRDGNKIYQEKRYESALKNYREAQVRNPDQAETQYNLGTALYQTDQFQEADEHFKKSIELMKDKDDKAKAWYNYGNSQYRLGQFEKAIDAYKHALDLNPADQDAKYNIELLQKKKNMFDIKQKNRDEKKNEQNQNQQKQNQQQSKQQQSQNQQQNPDQGEEEQNQQQKEQAEKEQQPKEQREQETPAAPQPDQSQNQQGGKPEEQQQKQLYQGQMSREDAERILNALKDTEQELQSIVRRPQEKFPDHNPEKDW